jgi:hypothetical protein
LDLPSLEPHAAPLSYLQATAMVSESADSNAANVLGSGSVSSVSRAMGTLTLRRLWSHYDLAADYAGGFGYYDSAGQGIKDLQQASLAQKISWKRTQLTLRDTFSYMPEGNFGGGYGSLGAVGVAGLGGSTLTGVLGGEQFGAISTTPRILSVSAADLEQMLTPKSALTAAGGYAFTHFFGGGISEPSFIASSQKAGEVAYVRLLSPKTQVAALYAYQGFDFNAVASALHAQIVEGVYGYRISGRMDFLAGAGPEFTVVGIPGEVCSNPAIQNALLCVLEGDTLVSTTLHDTRVGVAGQGRLRYQFPKTSLYLSYERLNTVGSGLFAGATSDIVRLSVGRPLTRVWQGWFDTGYSRNGRLQQLSAKQLATCTLPGQQNVGNPPLPPCPGADANTYSYEFVGGTLHRMFGRTLHGFMSYQFDLLEFDHSYCAGLPECSRTSNRQVLTFGLEWVPRPVRLD